MGKETEVKLRRMFADFYKHGDKAKLSSQLNALEMNLKKAPKDLELEDIFLLKKMKELL